MKEYLNLGFKKNLIIRLIILLTISYIKFTIEAEVQSISLVNDCSTTPCTPINVVDIGFTGLKFDRITLEVRNPDNGILLFRVVIAESIGFVAGDLDLYYTCLDVRDVNFDLICDCPGGSTLCPRSKISNSTNLYFDQVTTSKGCTFDWYEASVRTCGNVHFDTNSYSVFTEDFKEANTKIELAFYYYPSNVTINYSDLNIHADLQLVYTGIDNELVFKVASCPNPPCNTLREKYEKYISNVELLSTLTPAHHLKDDYFIVPHINAQLTGTDYYAINQISVNSKHEYDPYKACFLTTENAIIPESILNALNIKVQHCDKFEFTANENLGKLLNQLTPMNLIDNFVVDEGFYTFYTNLNRYLVSIKVKNGYIDYQGEQNAGVLTKVSCSEYITGQKSQCSVCGKSTLDKSSACKIEFYNSGILWTAESIILQKDETCQTFSVMKSENLTACLSCSFNNALCKNTSFVKLTEPPINDFLPTGQNHSPNGQPTSAPHISWFNHLVWWEKLLFIIGMIALGLVFMYIFFMMILPMIKMVVLSCWKMSLKQWENRKKKQMDRERDRQDFEKLRRESDTELDEL